MTEALKLGGRIFHLSRACSNLLSQPAIISTGCLFLRRPSNQIPASCMNYLLKPLSFTSCVRVYHCKIGFFRWSLRWPSGSNLRPRRNFALGSMSSSFLADFSSSFFFWTLLSSRSSILASHCGSLGQINNDGPNRNDSVNTAVNRSITQFDIRQSAQQYSTCSWNSFF